MKKAYTPQIELFHELIQKSQISKQDIFKHAYIMKNPLLVNI